MCIAKVQHTTKKIQQNKIKIHPSNSKTLVNFMPLLTLLTSWRLDTAFMFGSDAVKLLFSSWNDQVTDNRGLPPSDWKDADIKLPAEFDSENQISAFLGWDGLILFNDHADIISMSARYMAEVQNQSCGRCFPCRIGTAVMQQLLEKIDQGNGTPEDLAKLEELAKEVSSTSKCSIGQTGPIPVIHAIKYFKQNFEAKIRKSSPTYQNLQYEAKWTAPCYAACPTGMDIPAYIEAIKEGRPGDSLKVIREASPMAASLGRACFHPCESSCRRNNVESSISICKLKRYAWDFEDSRSVEKPQNPNRHTKDQKIAIIGGGPAGFSAAYYLALKGYRPTIFEALPVPGGMVGVGIPRYRVPKDVLAREAQYVLDMGAEVRYGVKVGTDITISDLRKEGYSAFFISTGAHLSKKMGAEGEDQNFEGFIKGIDYLRDCELTKCYDVRGKRVVVVGGGNVAMDCCRTPVRQGASEVTVVYRRTKKELPADPHEVEDSEKEGVKYEFLAAPKRIVAENGKVTGLECVRMELGEPDSSGRRSPVAVKGSEFVIPADIIIQAIGQDCDLSVLNGVEGLKISKWQTIEADSDTMQTAISDIFTGGDVFNGPLTIVDSCGNARRAADSIDQYLSGQKPSLTASEKMDKIMKKLGVYDKNENCEKAGKQDRVPMPTITIEARKTSFDEVETGYDLNHALEEASRCMRCYQVGMVALEKKA